MKILKPGKVEQRKFVCPNCGCVFLASKIEINADIDLYVCPQDGCHYYAIGWEDGEPYEEPTQGYKAMIYDRNAKEAILAIGALAELCGEFYKQLPAEALHLTSEWVRATVTPPQKNNP